MNPNVASSAPLRRFHLHPLVHLIYCTDGVQYLTLGFCQIYRRTAAANDGRKFIPRYHPPGRGGEECSGRSFRAWKLSVCLLFLFLLFLFVYYFICLFVHSFFRFIYSFVRSFRWLIFFSRFFVRFVFLSPFPVNQGVLIGMYADQRYKSGDDARKPCPLESVDILGAKKQVRGAPQGWNVTKFSSFRFV